jgi:hypothetical protein
MEIVTIFFFIKFFFLANVGFWDTFDPVNAQNLDQQYMFENAALTAEEMIDTHYKV